MFSEKEEIQSAVLPENMMPEEKGRLFRQEGG